MNTTVYTLRLIIFINAHLVASSLRALPIYSLTLEDLIVVSSVLRSPRATS